MLLIKDSAQTIGSKKLKGGHLSKSRLSKSLFHLFLSKLLQQLVIHICSHFSLDFEDTQLYVMAKQDCGSEKIDKILSESLLNGMGMNMDSVLLVNNIFDGVFRLLLVCTSMEILGISISMLIPMPLGTLLPFEVLLVHHLGKVILELFNFLHHSRALSILEVF